MSQGMRIPLAKRATLVVMCFFLLALMSSPSVRAQDSVLGQHTVNLRLKQIPVGEVLKILSGRSKAVAKQPDGVRPTDEGRPWEIDGADKLDGIFVGVNFVETPVEQMVKQLLGCVGFSYVEQGERITIEKSALMLPADQCTSVTRALPPGAASADVTSASTRKFSFQFESISAHEFVMNFSNEAKQNVTGPFDDIQSLKDIKLRVKVVDMQEEDVLKNALGCIGWKSEKTRMGYVISKSDNPIPRECSGFSIL
jgi:hypothetical protein